MLPSVLKHNNILNSRIEEFESQANPALYINTISDGGEGSDHVIEADELRDVKTNEA